MGKSHSEKQKNTLKLVAVGAALSALLGYLAGILTAPKSGRETREDIREKAGSTYASTERELKRLHTELTDLINNISSRVADFKNRKDVDAALEKGQAVKQKAREVLSTLHEGEAQDKDLKKAIKDATDAIEHLRNFLRK